MIKYRSAWNAIFKSIKNYYYDALAHLPLPVTQIEQFNHKNPKQLNQ